MDEPGGKYHSYRQALVQWIEYQYPFLEIHPFEQTAHPGHNRSWEEEKIRDAVLLVAVIFKDSDEVTHEIRQAMSLNNPVLLFFFPGKKGAKKTWAEFAESRRIKAKEASTWKELIESIRDSIDEWIIRLSQENKGKASYDPPQTTEEI